MPSRPLSDNEREALRKRLKKEYRNYLWNKKHNSGEFYGSWTAQFKQISATATQMWRSKVDTIMHQLGYDKWTEEDVKTELEEN
jgi:hypothetical protein